MLPLRAPPGGRPRQERGALHADTHSHLPFLNTHSKYPPLAILGSGAGGLIFPPGRLR